MLNIKRNRYDEVIKYFELDMVCLLYGMGNRFVSKSILTRM